MWLIPRFQQWIAQYAPNLTLPLAISEYSFGDDSMFSPALANAELLAVMGVYNIAYSGRWTSPAAGTVAENAFKLYLNYDGSLSKVTGSSVPTSTSAANSLNGYSVYDSSSKTLFVLLFNLAFSEDSAVSVTVSSASLASGGASLSASVWQMSAASTSLTQQPSATVNGGAGGLSLSGYTVPARSATLLVMKGVAQSTAAPSPSSSSPPRSSFSSSALSAPSSSSATAPAPTVTATSAATVPSSSSAATVPSSVSSTATSQTSTNTAAASLVGPAWMLSSLVLSVCVGAIAAVVV